MRVIFFAVPEDSSAAPKSVADGESEEARWCTIADLEQLGRSEPGLRGGELLEWARCAQETRAQVAFSNVMEAPVESALRPCLFYRMITSPEPHPICRYVEGGGFIAPLSILVRLTASQTSQPPQPLRTPHTQAFVLFDSQSRESSGPPEAQTTQQFPSSPPPR